MKFSGNVKSGGSRSSTLDFGFDQDHHECFSSSSVGGNISTNNMKALIAC